MSRPAAFTQADIAKLLKGAKAAGMLVASVEIDRSGKIVAKFGKPGGEDGLAPNEWDEVLNPDVQAQRPARQRL